MKSDQPPTETEMMSLELSLIHYITIKELKVSKLYTDFIEILQLIINN